jgi:hypothetical protein
MPHRPRKPKVELLPITDVEENNAQDRIAKMLKKSGYTSRFLEKLAGKHAQD